MKALPLPTNETNTEKIFRFFEDPLYRSLSAEERDFIAQVSKGFRLTHQQIKKLIDMAADIRCWDEGTLKDFWERALPSQSSANIYSTELSTADSAAISSSVPRIAPTSNDNSSSVPSGVPRGTPRIDPSRTSNREIMRLIDDRWEAMKKEEKSYTGFSHNSNIAPENIPSRSRVKTNPSSPHRPRIEILPDRGETILGNCPVAGEKTRCCNLQTLDAVHRCGYGCSYCSIESFYGDGAIFFHQHLADKLKKIDIDPDRIHHIGTGQSSDSLMWGNREGLLDNLFDFAAVHPNVILELKTKSAASGPLIEAAGKHMTEQPLKIIAGWTLNTPTIIAAEERLTATLDERLRAARETADTGIKVGFHFHPMILYREWRQDYCDLVDRLQRMFTPEEVAMVSLGSVTLIKPVIRRIRLEGRRTKILRMPLVETAGKYSYHQEIKIDLFRTVYERFTPEWKKNVFFYLCMEHPDIWEPVFGFSFCDNKEFETAMKESYLNKLGYR